MKNARRFFTCCLLLMVFLWSQIVWSFGELYTLVDATELTLIKPNIPIENITLITDDFEQGASKYFSFSNPTFGSPFMIGGQTYSTGGSGTGAMVQVRERGYIARLEGTSLLAPRDFTVNFRTWENYTVKVDYKKESTGRSLGSSYFSLRYNEAAGFCHGYWIEDTGTQLILYRQNKCNSTAVRQLLTSQNRAATLGWNTLEMSVDSTTVSGGPATQIAVYLNSQLIISHIDSMSTTYTENGSSVQYGPVAFGGISFGTDGVGSILLLDNLNVTGRVSGSQTWHQTKGPEGGLITDIAVDPGDANIVYVSGYDGGLYRSLDGGGNWSEVGLPNGMVNGVRIRNIEVHPKYPNNIYVGMASKHVTSLWRSENRGNSWFWTGAGDIDKSEQADTHAIALDPDDPKKLYFGLTSTCNEKGKRIDGVYYSDDGAAKNLTRLTYGSGTGNGCQETYNGNIVIKRDPLSGEVIERMADGGGLIGALAINPHNKLHLLAGTYLGKTGAKTAEQTLLSSPDGGKTWEAYGAGLSFGGTVEIVREIKFHPQMDGLVYLTTDSGRFFWRNYLNTSMNEWQPGTALLGDMVRGILFFPQTNAPAKVAVYSQLGIKLSANYGRDELPWSQHSPVFGMVTAAVAPSDPNRVYATDGVLGMIYSTDGGKTFPPSHVINKGLKVHPIRAVSIAKNNTQKAYAASDNGVFRSVDGGESWSPTILTGMFNVIAVDPQNDDIVYAGGGDFDGTSSYLYRSPDGGMSWDELNVDEVSFSIGSILVHPQSSDWIFIGAGPGVQGACNAGPGTSSKHKKWALGGMYYKASDEGKKCWATGLWFSPDAGKTFTKITSVPDRIISDIKVSPVNDNIMVVGTLGEGVYLSLDAGKSFNSINGNVTQGIQDSLENSVAQGKMVWTIALHPSNAQIIYAGTNSQYPHLTNGAENALYVTYDQGSTWLSLLNNKENAQTAPATLQYKDYVMINFGGGVDAIALDPKYPNRIFVALHDPGVIVTEDGGKNWRYANEGLMPTLAHLYPYRLIMSPDGSYLLSATCGRSIFKNRLAATDIQSALTNYVMDEVIPLYEFMEIMLSTDITSENMLQTYQYNIGLKE
ncbi:MAG: hypothetical protein HYV97_08045 [Bdellovibrio sp.]|nr:hypothetical protein [Bdellovibrio sp.]